MHQCGEMPSSSRIQSAARWSLAHLKQWIDEDGGVQQVVPEPDKDAPLRAAPNGARRSACTVGELMENGKFQEAEAVNKKFQCGHGE